MSKINLYISLYDIEDKVRYAEIKTCLKANHSLFDTIHVLAEGRTIGLIKVGFINHYHDHRPTYADFFRLINETTGPNDINIIANADIYFDATIALAENIKPNQCYAITRHEANRGQNGDESWYNGRHPLELGPDSQDVWVFRGKVKFNLESRGQLAKSNLAFPEGFGKYHLGQPGCDNRLAHDLKEAGYKLLNPCHDIKCWHVHQTPKSYDHQTPRVPEPYLRVPHSGVRQLKMLHLSIDGHNNPQNGLNRALDSAYDVDRIHYGGKGLMEMLQAYPPKDKPDIIFSQIQHSFPISELVLKRFSCPKINWTGDIRDNIPQVIKDLAPLIDLQLFTNMEDVDNYNELYGNAEYFQIGYDTEQYSREGDKIDCPEIVFLGNNYANQPSKFPLSEERKRMVQLLKRTYGKRFGVYGGGWGFDNGNYMNDPGTEAKILRSAKVVINMSHYARTRYWSDRLIRSLGCGAYVLSHKWPELEKDWKAGVHFDTFTDMDELLGKINQALSGRNQQRIDKIRRFGYNHAHDRQSWAYQIHKLDTFIKQLVTNGKATQANTKEEVNNTQG